MYHPTQSSFPFSGSDSAHLKQCVLKPTFFALHPGSGQRQGLKSGKKVDIYIEV